MREFIDTVVTLVETMVVTQQTLSQAIQQVSAEYIEKGLAPNVYEINNGHCESLAKDVVAMLGGENDIFETVEGRSFCNDNDSDDPSWDVRMLKKYWPKCRPINGLTWRDVKYEVPSHVWIVFQKRHYDAEAPEGVDNFFELPLIRRGMEYIVARKAGHVTEGWTVQPTRALGKTVRKILLREQN
jgi:hypothetical protein